MRINFPPPDAKLLTIPTDAEWTLMPTLSFDGYYLKIKYGFNDVDLGFHRTHDFIYLVDREVDPDPTMLRDMTTHDYL